MREEVLYEVFLDLKRDYDALNWERCLEILVAYGVGTRKERLLCKYWGGGDHNGIQGRAILWRPVHGIQGDHTGIPAATHRI